MPFEVRAIRREFPALSDFVHGQPLVYLDNAATAQVPQAVLDALVNCEQSRGNVHRGIHRLSEQSTADYEAARATAAHFLGAEPEQICFTSGTTDGINRVARSLEPRLGPGDCIVTTRMEHHSNFLPWQQVCRRTGAQLLIAPLTPAGELDQSTLEELLTPQVRLLAVTQCSNVLGTVNDVAALCAMAHARGIPVLVDGAQSVCHRSVDVTKLSCDWLVFSGHKLGGPFGIGVLYARCPAEPVVFGGGMVEDVGDTDALFSVAPQSAEAGTPNVSGAVGLAAAIRFRQAIPEGWQSYETGLLQRTEERLSQLPGVHILGTPQHREGCVSFTVDSVQPFDLALLADQKGIALRSGHHCAQPLLHSLGLDYALRVSPCYYNTEEEIDYLGDSLEQILKLLRP